MGKNKNAGSNRKEKKQKQQHEEMELLSKKEDTVIAPIPDVEAYADSDVETYIERYAEADIKTEKEKKGTKALSIFKFLEFLFAFIVFPIDLVFGLSKHIQLAFRLDDIYKFHDYKSLMYKLLINGGLSAFSFFLVHIFLWLYSPKRERFVIDRWSIAISIIFFLFVTSLCILGLMVIYFYKSDQFELLLNIVLIVIRGFSFMSSLILLAIVSVESRKTRNSDTSWRSRRLCCVDCSIETIMCVITYLMILFTIIASLSTRREVLDGVMYILQQLQ